MKRIFLITILSSTLIAIAVSSCLIWSENQEKQEEEYETTDIHQIEQEITQKILKRERGRRNMMMAVIVLTVVASSIIVDRIALSRRRSEIRNRRLKMDFEKTEHEMERYKALYREVQQEKEVLSDMQRDGEINEEMKNLLEERLNILNRFIAAYISGNCSEEAYAELEKMMSNKRSFIDSTRLSFAIAHPHFLIYLKEKGLTDLEIGYCCLHAIGLRGKEIVSYLNSRTYYNASSTIRRKLGLNEHDTNINLYIQKLLEDIDESTEEKSRKHEK